MRIRKESSDLNLWCKKQYRSIHYSQAYTRLFRAAARRISCDALCGASLSQAGASACIFRAPSLAHLCNSTYLLMLCGEPPAKYARAASRTPTLCMVHF